MFNEFKNVLSDVCFQEQGGFKSLLNFISLVLQLNYDITLVANYRLAPDVRRSSVLRPDALIFYPHSWIYPFL